VMTCELLPMGRIAKVSTRKGNGATKAAGPDTGRELDLTALQQTPGFLVRILQLQNFEAFYPYFEALKLSPLEYAILVAVRDNKAVTQSELAAVLKMQLPNLVKILSRMEASGTIRRKRSARDKRAVELSLSADGERRADQASRLGASFNAQTLAPLDRQERAAFLQMLARLIEGYRRAAS
jgi:DNA-binding MarR family transcriptional regulator